MLPEFELLVPRTLPEALEILAQRAPDVTPVAGGTNVIVNLRDRCHPYKMLMDVSRLHALRGIHSQDGYMVVGGGTTVAQLLTDPLIAQYGAPLNRAAAVLGSPLVRNRATVAGNLVDASPAADTVPPLLVLEAEVELASHQGARRVPLETFLVGPNKTLLQPDELMVAIRWPLPRKGSRADFQKIGLRKTLACAVITVAVMVESDEKGRCRRARIALGAVAPTPIRSHAAEDILTGQRLTPQRIAEAGYLSAEAAHPIDDVRGTEAYRRRMVKVLVRRLLTAVADEVGLLEGRYAA